MAFLQLDLGQLQTLIPHLTQVSLVVNGCSLLIKWNKVGCVQVCSNPDAVYLGQDLPHLIRSLSIFVFSCSLLETGKNPARDELQEAVQIRD